MWLGGVTVALTAIYRLMTTTTRPSVEDLLSSVRTRTIDWLIRDHAMAGGDNLDVTAFVLLRSAIETVLEERGIALWPHCGDHRFRDVSGRSVQTGDVTGRVVCKPTCVRRTRSPQRSCGSRLSAAPLRCGLSSVFCPVRRSS